MSRPANKHPEFIGLQEAADRMGVCYRTMRRYVATGALDAVRVGPRLLKVDAAALEGLMQPVGGGATYPEGVSPPPRPKPRTHPADSRAPAADRLAELDGGAA